MPTSAIRTTALGHYAETIRALHDMDRANESLRWRQVAVMCAILVALGVVFVGFG